MLGVMLGDTLGVEWILFNHENIPIRGTTCSHVGNEMFPAWEPNISIQGMSFEALGTSFEPLM